MRPSGVRTICGFGKSSGLRPVARISSGSCPSSRSKLGPRAPIQSFAYEPWTSGWPSDVRGPVHVAVEGVSVAAAGGGLDCAASGADASSVSPAATRKPVVRIRSLRVGRIERLLQIVHLPLGFFDRRSGSAEFPLDDAVDGPLVVANQRQALLDRRLTRAELHVRAVIAAAILDVQVRDAVVMLLEEVHRVVIAGGEVTDVEVDDEVLRHGEQLFKRRCRCDLDG